MTVPCVSIGMRMTGIEPVWTGSGAGTREFRSGGAQGRCVYQFHHTRIDRQMGVSGPGNEGILSTVRTLVARLVFWPPSRPQTNKIMLVYLPCGGSFPI